MAYIINGNPLGQIDWFYGVPPKADTPTTASTPSEPTQVPASVEPQPTTTETLPSATPAIIEEEDDEVEAVAVEVKPPLLDIKKKDSYLFYAMGGVIIAAILVIVLRR